MNIALLSRQPDLYANQRFVQAAHKNGHALSIIDPLNCILLLQDSKIEISHPDHIFTDFDFVLPRFGPIWQRQGNTVLKELEVLGLVSLNSSDSIAIARDKLQCFKLFQENHIPFPKSASVESIQQIELILKKEFDFPILLKLNNSAQGRGVEIFHQKNELLARVQQLFARAEAFMIQEFIAEAKGVDYRLFVLNGEVIASMKRTATEGEFRSNIHMGGIAEFYFATQQEQCLALKAVSLLGLDVAGVDIVYNKEGPMVLEVNACPGFEALERVSGLNLAEKMLNFMISERLSK